ncbi:Glyoxylase, beta-lactamase superfamily II [Bizionia echini]|uniref:Glyoxylase, beta-lactamase superfamily II n=1 Tax=Bizionia echini TaxID=649333 RepID=A0A1I5AWB8_9FLAO|nr:MBL fold metallo-hydrolase [Bizionia echini]SFN66519.1 Glyoxylase, beta-lactamase superfamily II [Bizionia echini]
MKYFKILPLFAFIVLSTSCSEAKTKKGAQTNNQTDSEIRVSSDFVQQKISDNLYILKHKNYNTNTGVFIGAESVLLIDPMSGNNNQQALLNAIKQLSGKPIKYVVNTHSHMDHSGANGFFKQLGATIISHENTKYSKAMYDVTFKDSYTLDMGNETVELYHSIAHTFDDVMVHFENNNTLFMGDTFMTNSFPHFYYGGGSKGHLEFIDKALALGDTNTIIIPAHGTLSSNKKALTEYKEHSIKWINRIKQLHSEGKSSEDMADDAQINQLSLFFNNGKSISKQSIQRTLDKTISVDLVASVIVPENILKSYEGTYHYDNGQVDEIIYQNGQLLFRSKGRYIYEIVSLSETKFHVNGQFPNKYLIFKNNGDAFEFFNGKETIVAKKQS